MSCPDQQRKEITSLISSRVRFERAACYCSPRGSSLTCLITSYPHSHYSRFVLKKHCSESNFSQQPPQLAFTHTSAQVTSLRTVTTQSQRPDRRTANRREFEQLDTSANCTKQLAAIDPCSHCSLVPVASDCRC